MRYGRSTTAQAAIVRVGYGAPAALRNAPQGRGPMVGYTPQPAYQQPWVGNDSPGACGPPNPGEQGQQGWCYNTTSAGPTPIGASVPVPAAVAGVPGVGVMTLLPIEAFTLDEIVFTDPTGALLASAIVIGRCNFIEAGNISLNSLQSANTRCKLLRGINIYPTTGAVFTILNPTLAVVTATVTGFGWPVPCPQPNR